MQNGPTVLGKQNRRIIRLRYACCLLYLAQDNSIDMKPSSVANRILRLNIAINLVWLDYIIYTGTASTINIYLSHRDLKRGRVRQKEDIRLCNN